MKFQMPYSIANCCILIGCVYRAPELKVALPNPTFAVSVG